MAKLDLGLEVFSRPSRYDRWPPHAPDDPAAPPPFRDPPLRAAELLPWRQLEGVALRGDAGSLVSPLVLQPELAPMLTRLRALIIELDADPEGLAARGMSAPPMARALWRAPWLGQLTKLHLCALRYDCDAPPADGGAPPLLGSVEELDVEFFPYGGHYPLPGPAAAARLLAGCDLGLLRGLTLGRFVGARAAVAPRARELVALTRLMVDGGDEWNAAANQRRSRRERSLAAFLSKPAAFEVDEFEVV